MKWSHLAHLVLLPTIVSAEVAQATTAITTTQTPALNSDPMNPQNHQKFANDLTEILFKEPNECTSSLGISMAVSLVYPGATNDGITQIKILDIRTMLYQITK